MTEKRARYEVGGAGGVTLQDLARRDCARLFEDPAYRPPTPDEVDALIKLAGWSQNKAAKVAGVKFDPDKGSRTIRTWRSPKGSAGYREIPYAAWRLLLLTAGVVPAPGEEEVRQVADGAQEG